MLLDLFFENLLTAQNLKTVVSATFHNVQPSGGKVIDDFAAIDMWYERLDKRYNFSLAPAILGLMTTDNLEELEKLDPPYLEEYKRNRYHNISALFGIKMLSIFFLQLLDL